MATVRTWLVNGMYSISHQHRLDSTVCVPLTHIHRFKRTGKRDQIFLATKFGNTPTSPNGKPEYVRSTFEKSLKRLGVEQIDLYYFHVSTHLQIFAQVVP